MGRQLKTLRRDNKSSETFTESGKRKNPSQRKYNLSLKEYIYIRMVSIVETSEHAAKSHLSTLAVLQLDSILTGARKLLILLYDGIKLTVGVQKTTQEKVQYCLTALGSVSK